mmetsp:Transcript_32807/g.110574  ORF Transcript_32807/g.110574 Transcript_32807/m.110574 type:complete len:445 (-) Transcript_32807:325-1659(-)
MISVDRAACNSGNGVVDEARLVQSVRVDGHRDVVLVGKGQTRVNRRWRRAPVLVQLEATRPRGDDLEEARRVGRVALAGKPKVQREDVRRAEHHLDLRRGGRACRRARPRRRARPATVHCRNPRRNRFRDLLRADEVNVRVDGPRRDDEAFCCNRLRVDADDHARRDAVHAVRVPCFANPHNQVPFDPDIRLDDAELGADDESVGDDHVQGINGGDARGLALALAQRLAAAKLAFVSVDPKVLLDAQPQRRVAEAHAVARRRAVRGRVVEARHSLWRARRRGEAQRRVAKAARSHARHHLGAPRLGSLAVDEQVARLYDFAAADGDQSDSLGVSRFKPHGRPTGHVEAEAVRLLAVEDERLVRLDEVEVRSDLDGPVSRIDDAELETIPARVQLDGPLQRLVRARRHHVLVVAEDRQRGHRQEGSMQRELEFAVEGADGRMDRQ